ncbi:MAG: hypothetical protein U9R41_00020 [Candidatus Marinimicrobia bacterium]|nr:hypothetical protein [Candidatus Neomarinimicrobiota bacterium]
MPKISKIKNTMKIDSKLKKEIVEKNKVLFWDENDLDKVSKELVVEKNLSFGTFDTVQKMINIIGMKDVAKIFKTKIKNKRHNFSFQTENYFTLYFKKHA